ncbi:hypothetical protein GF359_05730 [candidate division WOR-3 bacterium]|uniref:Outer membrane protein beta-barrel domain-containing protein n=1 Tax=candidate division WOR-3 bacterium TaxID=2052148 RepID=A0A9D5K9A6_UNCW3|nr:hypothetical protein [candidate division WOR-3 bacterium]MBD3364697.1 hypothetical protein [candidate division WOR-3 bacterium]
MKRLGWFALVILLAITACISPPVYNTATSPQGLSVGAGVAYMSAERGFEWSDVEAAGDTTHGRVESYLTGVRPDVIISYGVTPTFSVEGRFGALFTSRTLWDGEDEDSDYNDSLRMPVPLVGVGFKFSTPGEKMVNFALRMDVDIPNVGALTPMMGLSTKSGHEYLTLGVQTSMVLLPQTAFINIHPFKGAHIYGAIDFIGFNAEIQNYRLDGSPMFKSFTAGIGYAYNFGKE